MKKNIKNGVGAILQETKRENAKTVVADLRAGDKKQINVVISTRTHAQLKVIATQQGRKLKDVYAEALEFYLIKRQD